MPNRFATSEWRGSGNGFLAGISPRSYRNAAFHSTKYTWFYACRTYTKFQWFDASTPTMPLSRLFSVLLVTSTLFVTGCGPRKVDGNYSGRLRNESYGIEADVFISLKESNGYLSGSMTIGAPLHGGGAISGQRDGDYIRFTTGNGVGGQIVWIGEINHRRLGGTYVVQPTEVMALLGDTEKQQGIWLVER